MAIGTNLPPQAYTRETLTQAFNWLQSQPESVKRMAPNPDALVALYIRSQRFGGETEAPVSSQNFISDLKHLAEGLKQFEQPAKAPTVAAPPPPRPQVAATIPGNSATGAQPSWVDMLHPNSQAMLAQVKDQFNLTSDTEAVNLMIALAFKSFKNLI